MISIKSFGFTIKNSGFLSKNDRLGVPPIGHFWCFYSKMPDWGVPPIGHFWIKMSKNAIFDVFIKKMQFLMFFFDKNIKNCIFWHFYSKNDQFFDFFTIFWKNHESKAESGKTPLFFDLKKEQNGGFWHHS